MNILDTIGLDWDDVFLVPKRGTVNSRAEVDLDRYLESRRHGRWWTGFPVIVSNMDNTGTIKMAEAVTGEAMSVALHKFYDEKTLIDFFNDVERSKKHFYTTGIRDEDIEKLERVSREAYIGYICVDAPNAYIPKFLTSVDKIRKICPKAFIMAGNCATPNIVRQEA